MRQASQFQGYDLGATLYMPILQPKVPDILSGTVDTAGSSLVLCLEDALAENDVEAGIARLRNVLRNVSHRPDLKVFVRPRSLEMAHRLSSFEGIQSISGFVAPKLRPENAADWLDLVQKADLQIMPTLETADYFDQSKVIAVRDIIAAYDPQTVAAVRIGGNDLLGVMGLRRERGITSYEGALGWLLGMMGSTLVASGLPTAAPVFDIIDDLDTLQREVKRDVAMGFVSKTAIHPSQVPIIENEFQVSEEDLCAADAILEKSAKAVFQIGGAMCEPATHLNWAKRIKARQERFGLRKMNLYERFQESSHQAQHA
jgi:citrate lyase beta subunit